MDERRRSGAAGPPGASSATGNDGSTWALPLLRHGETPAEGVERLLMAAAGAAATGDTRARDALYHALAAPVAAGVARYRRRAWSAGVWDLDDVRQEGYLAFVDTIGEWAGERPFVGYFVVKFRQRLADAVRRLDLHPAGGALAGPALLLHDESAAAAESLALIETLAAAWPEPDRSILLLKVRDGEGLGSIAQTLGLSHRTVIRRWRRLRDALRATLTERAGPASWVG